MNAWTYLLKYPCLLTLLIQACSIKYGSLVLLNLISVYPIVST